MNEEATPPEAADVTTERASLPFDLEQVDGEDQTAEEILQLLLPAVFEGQPAVTA